ncbi:pleckstrin homology domain-containing family N member 1 isoform X2 [Vombatus ursinus]|uniref:pleckstrin homology domain-containing family N member 1 isoform X2 n=1 Tax=Vombatus ursinus TaxID=29139 RepID=UPI000FFCE369|nr:pleckstrin homology domain-containing family N member 1 isoform X2 [Vombatus ursinus]
MGNANCVPQAPRFRASFSRKSSLKGKKEDSIRRRGGLFGSESSQDGDTKATDKILYYIPGTDIPGPESHKENVDQPFLSVFKKGRQKMPVRNLGKIVHYAKVKFKFQHCPDINDCYLELFPSCLYFQAHGSSGLTYQGLLPLTMVSISRLEIEGEYAFQITGPLPSPLLVFCPSKAELRRWLYHLEKQMDLVRGPQCPSLQFQGPLGENHLYPLPWALKHYPVHHWEGTSRESLGDVVCASRVKMQHLPSQEQHDRILVLYPSTLVILSEDSDGLNFKGELPLNAIQLNFEESDKQIRSFLIEGHLINTIRVLCASYEDYQDWLLCFRAIRLRRGGSSTRSGSESFQGPRPPLPTQGQANPNTSSLGRRRAELRRRSSSRSSKGKGAGQLKGEEPVLRAPLRLDLGLTNLNRRSPEVSEEATADTPEKPQSPLYADPYTPTSTTHNKITDVSDLDEFLVAAKSCIGREPLSTFPTIPVSIPVPVPSPSLHPLQKKPAPQHRESPRHRGSFQVRGAGALEPSRTRQVQVTPSKEGSPDPQLRLPGGSSPSGKGHEQGRSSSEPSSGQRDFSYDNIWDKPGPPSSSRHKWHCPPASEAAGRLTQWI